MIVVEGSLFKKKNIEPFISTVIFPVDVAPDIPQCNCYKNEFSTENYFAHNEVFFSSD